MAPASSRSGLFTLLEIVPVFSLILVMAGVIYVLTNPMGNLEDARNEQRRADLTLIADAIAEYTRDEGTGLLVNIPSTPIEICADARGNACSSKLSLNLLLGEYLHEIPRDPSLSSSDPVSESGYNAQITSDRKVQLSAPSAEGGATIEVIR